MEIQLHALIMLQFLACFISVSASEQHETNYFEYGVKVIPHPSKVQKGGEDAFYADNYVLSVADGVGGWAEHGIDPSFYSRSLCKNVGALFNQNRNMYENNPKKLIIDSNQGIEYEGSSTLVVATIDSKKPFLYAAYIGDSGYMVFRFGKHTLQLEYEFKEQQKSFNYPYQLSRANVFDPSLSISHKYRVQHKDILILGSDGLFDNLDADQIKAVIMRNLGQDHIVRNHTELANDLAKEAFEFSLNENYLSPFGRRAKEHNIYYLGGKSDDITVISSQIFFVEEKKKNDKQDL